MDINEIKKRHESLDPVKDLILLLDKRFAEIYQDRADLILMYERLRVLVRLIQNELLTVACGEWCGKTVGAV